LPGWDLAAAAESWLPHWFATPSGVAATSIVTLVGLPLALYGIARTARASKAARSATSYTRLLLRTAELRHWVETTLALGHQILQLGIATKRSRSGMSRLGGEWLDAERHVFGLMRDQDSVEAGPFRAAMLSAAMTMRSAVDASRSASRWDGYDWWVLSESLHSYGETAEALLRAADDEVLNA